MATPDFIERDVNIIVTEMVADYEQRTGRTLQPAQVERLLINAFAYREAIIRNKIQYAALQNLVEFSNAPVLDELGRLVGVTRLAASSASVELEFTLVSGHGGVTIPAGTRVASVDNLAVFAVANDTIVAPGVTTSTVTANSITTGTAANNYALGTVEEILDPLAFVSSATNTTVSGGGAAIESDEALRERIKLAPSTFSNAGSRGAYEYFALSASPSIIDVSVLGPNDVPASSPGEVNIFPLMEDGSVTPSTVLNAVLAACNDEKVRPLTDLVNVYSPSRIDYDIEIDVTIFTDADPTVTQADITTKLNAFVLSKRQTLGQDVKLSQIIAQSVITGVYDVSVVSPLADIIISNTEFAYCNSVTVNIIGSTDG
jgi:phage-related baseplate assembly protein